MIMQTLDNVYLCDIDKKNTIPRMSYYSSLNQWGELNFDKIAFIESGKICDKINYIVLTKETYVRFVKQS